jgi:hypothetical protein
MEEEVRSKSCPLLGYATQPACYVWALFGGDGTSVALPQNEHRGLCQPRNLISVHFPLPRHRLLSII